MALVVGNTDLGDPVYAIADGIVSFSGDLKGGWGNVVRIFHNKGTELKKAIKKGDKLAQWQCQWKYLAHLHLEIRDNINCIGRIPKRLWATSTHSFIRTIEDNMTAKVEIVMIERAGRRPTADINKYQHIGGLSDLRELDAMATGQKVIKIPNPLHQGKISDTIANNYIKIQKLFKKSNYLQQNRYLKLKYHKEKEPDLEPLKELSYLKNIDRKMKQLSGYITKNKVTEGSVESEIQKLASNLKLTAFEQMTTRKKRLTRFIKRIFLYPRVEPGATYAGLVCGLVDNQQAIGYSVLRDESMQERIRGFVNKEIEKEQSENINNWKLEQADFGGYAKLDKTLLDFIFDWLDQTGILLDPVYTSKMCMRLMQQIEAGEFESGTSICMLHSGGLQGWRGMEKKTALAVPIVKTDSAFQQSTMIGKVFHDRNGNGHLDSNEEGIPGVRLATVGVNSNSQLTGVIRSCPEDFQVDEIPVFEPSGKGEHVLLHIQKTGENTDWVAGILAKIAGVPRRDVSYAGLKDRNAVTTQWFSVQMPGKEAPDWKKDLPDSIVLLDETRHDRKLKRGTLKGNQFKLISA
ncbi:tRNA pseudouridine synthase D [Nymphon striatum]|nr:tRNA pseudouridine synthase D [Nymphon striatum]